MIEYLNVELKPVTQELVFEIKTRRSFQSAISLMVQKETGKHFVTALSCYLIRGTNIASIDKLGPIQPGIYDLNIFFNPDPLEDNFPIRETVIVNPIKPVLSRRLVVE